MFGNIYILVASLIYIVEGQSFRASVDKAIGNDDVESIMVKYNLQKFAEALRTTKLFQIFHEKENFTVFAPTNDAVGDHTKNLTFKEMRRFTEYHVYPGTFQIFSLRDGLKITSLDGNEAYVNRYYTRITKKTRIWIEGGEIDTQPLKVGNSILYIIDSYIERPTKTFFEYLKESGGHQMLLQLLEKYKLHFQFPFGTTFLAPYDQAFDHIPTRMKEYIMGDHDRCREFLRNHIITRPLCRGRLFHAVGWSKVINTMGNTLTLYQNHYHKQSSFVNSASVIKSQQIKEGWVYGLSELILPQIKQNAFDVLQKTRCKTFLNYLKASGHLGSLTSVISVHTIFAPTDDAFEMLDSTIQKKLKTDRDYLRNLVNFHMVQGKHLTELMYKKNYFQTFSMDNGTMLRLFVNNVMGSIQDSRIIESDKLASNGIIHIIDKVFIPPTQSLNDVIHNSKNLRLFRKIYHLLDSSIREVIESDNNVKSLFLPTNNALKRFYIALNTTSQEQAVVKLGELLFSRHVFMKPVIFLKNGLTKLSITTRDENQTLNVEIIRHGEKKILYTIRNYESYIMEVNLITRNGILHVVDKMFCDVGECVENEIVEEESLQLKWKVLQKRWKYSEELKNSQQEPKQHDGEKQTNAYSKS